MMRNIIVIIITLMPILVLGQNKDFSKDYIPEEDEPQINLVHHVSNDLEQSIETALIDDRKWDRSLIKFDFNKYYSLSFAAKNQGVIRFEDKQKSGYQNLFEVKPLLDFKVNFKNHLLREDLF